MRARRPGEREPIETGLVMRSIGYVGTPLPGVPFDERRSDHPQRRRARARPRDRRADPGRLRRRLDQARALRRDRHQQEGRAGDDDAAAGGLRGGACCRCQPSSPTSCSLSSSARGVHLVEYDGWEAIDAHERTTRRAARPTAREAGQTRAPARSGRRPTRDPVAVARTEKRRTETTAWSGLQWRRFTYRSHMMSRLQQILAPRDRVFFDLFQEAAANIVRARRAA